MKLPGKYSITIIDNGPGINATKKDSIMGTGKGLEIVDEMIQLYYNLKKVRITYYLENGRSNEVFPGTRVVISIPG
jgi:sensor histidine kinase YesM